ncbi:MAG: hypothetical protein RMZ69_15585 [Nostoc sp. ChiQUE01a]|nr:hypothetical protein [Nostoc sp. ChiQUE01a]
MTTIDCQLENPTRLVATASSHGDAASFVYLTPIYRSPKDPIV